MEVMDDLEFKEDYNFARQRIWLGHRDRTPLQRKEDETYYMIAATQCGNGQVLEDESKVSQNIKGPWVECQAF